MKALTIKQPWAHLIATGQKDIENRSWPTELRGRVFIHTSKTVDNVDVAHWCLSRGLRAHISCPLAYGAIIGEVDIVDCVTQSTSPWFIGPYGFVLANPRAYDVPIPYRGQLGFFNVELPPEGGHHEC